LSLTERFAAELTAVAGTPHRGADPEVLAVELAGPAPAVVAVDDEEDLAGVATARARAGHHVIRPADPEWRNLLPDAPLGVTRCTAALADTGTLVMVFGPGRPRSTSLVPRTHMAVVKESEIVPSLADGLARVPRPPVSGMTLVTGPSRSGDIEQILTLGVHGPAAVHVVVVEEKP
jgi:L-lactate dehydrogenase complex protein LldG